MTVKLKLIKLVVIWISIGTLYYRNRTHQYFFLNKNVSLQEITFIKHQSECLTQYISNLSSPSSSLLLICVYCVTSDASFPQSYRNINLQLYSVSVFYCCVINCHKLNGLRYYPFIISQLCRSEVWTGLRWILFPVMFLAESSFLQLESSQWLLSFLGKAGEAVLTFHLLTYLPNQGRPAQYDLILINSESADQ